MVGGVESVAGVSALMLVGSYGAGLMPAVLKIKSQRHLQLVSEPS